MKQLEIVFMVDPTIVRGNPFHHQYFFENRAIPWAKALAAMNISVGLIYPSIYPKYEGLDDIALFPINPWDLYSHNEQVNSRYRSVAPLLKEQAQALGVSFWQSTIFMWEGNPRFSRELDCTTIEMSPGVFSREPFPFSIRFNINAPRSTTRRVQTVTAEIINALKAKHASAIQEEYERLVTKYPVILSTPIIHPLGLDNYYNYIDSGVSQEEILHNCIAGAHVQRQRTLFTEHVTPYASGFLIPDAVSDYINSTKYCVHIKELREEKSVTQFLAYKHTLEAPYMSTSLNFHADLWKKDFTHRRLITDPSDFYGVTNTLPDCYLHEHPEVFVDIALNNSVKYVDLNHWLSEAVYA